MTEIPDEAVSDELVEAVLNAEEGIEKAPEWYKNDKRADIPTQDPIRFTVATSSRQSGKTHVWVKALLDQAQGHGIEVTVIGSTDDEIRADERQRILDLLPLPDEDARSGMIHARTLIAAQIAERDGK